MIRTPHIVWDWNGTLLGDGRIMMRSVIAAFACAGLPAVTIEDHRKHFTRPIPTFFERLAKRPLSDADHRAIQQFFEAAYRELAVHLTLSPHASEVLERWAAVGRTQSLLSMHPHEKLIPEIERYGISDRFIRVDGYKGYGADTKAEHLKAHLTALGDPSPDDVILIGDTVDDVLAAQSAGLRCVIFHDTLNALQDLRQFDRLTVPVIRTLPEILKHFEC
ncbi:HAD hydrolase-like protein [Streptomyces sp. NBC_00457]|uniref:HAD family hydrolase n=1 Tax=Streptomyces sp. NBC_00457 TaxID=2975748 RepID=UPI002E239AC3